MGADDTTTSPAESFSITLLSRPTTCPPIDRPRERSMSILSLFRQPALINAIRMTPGVSVDELADRFRVDRWEMEEDLRILEASGVVQRCGDAWTHASSGDAKGL